MKLRRGADLVAIRQIWEASSFTSNRPGAGDGNLDGFFWTHGNPARG